MPDTDCRSCRKRFLPSAAGALLVALLSYVSPAPAGGQSLGAIHGIVKDQQGLVLLGVILTATPRDNRPPLSVQTDTAGFYALNDLPPGEYEVKAELSGFATAIQSVVQARAGLTLSLDLVMAVGTIGETLTVRRDAPLLDMSSPTTAVNISGALQRSLPLSGRSSWSDFLLLVPGSIPQESFNGFLYTLHGSGTGSKVVLIDGHDANGADATSAAPDILNLSTEAIADVQVSTAGIPSSTPLGESAVINLATKSGTDRMAGSARVDIQPEKANATNTPGGTANRISSTQAHAAIGGPLLRSKAWFFASYQRLVLSTGIYRSPERLAALRSLSPGFTPFDNARSGHYFYVKPSITITPQHHATVSYRRDPTSIDSGSEYADRQFSRSRAGGTSFASNVSSAWSSSLSTQFKVAYNDILSVTSRSDGGPSPSRSVYTAVVPSSGGLLGSGLLAILDNTPASVTSSSDKLTSSFDLSYSPPRLLGRHTLRTGIFLQRLHFDSGILYPNGGFAQENLVLRDPTNTNGGTIPFQRVVFDSASQYDRLAVSDDFAAYIEDTWVIGSRLTFTAGVRLDHIRSRDRPFDIETQNSVDIGPRFGAAYALTRDGYNVVRFSATRRHDGPSSTAVSASTNALGRTDSYDMNADGLFETSFIVPAATAVSTDRVFASDFHQPYVDEYTLGYQRQAAGGVTLGATFIHQSFLDRPTGVEINGIYDNGQFAGYRDPGLSTVYLVTNNKWHSTYYRAVELQAAKHTSIISLVGSYTRQWRTVSGTWQPADPSGIIQPEAFPNARGLTNTSSTVLIGNLPSTANSYLQGGSQQWRDHTFSVSGSWHAPFALTIAASYNFASGLWSGPLLSSLGVGDPRFGPPTIRLSTGRTVQNPLATPLRFNGPTRNDGQFLSPALHRLGLSIGRTWSAGRYRIEPTVRVLNVTNNDADQALASQANRTFSPSFGQWTLRQPPRALVATCRLSF